MNNLTLVDENQEVRKAQALVKSRYKLNPVALKLVTTLISMVQKEDTPEQEYCLRVRDYINNANLKGESSFLELKEACYEIMSKPIYIGKKGTKDFLIANWASSCEYIHDEGIIKFQISPKLLPYIINLKEKYLKYDLKNILPLRSDYVIRLYEWLKDEFNTNARYHRKAELIITLKELREKFEIPDSYSYRKIKERILDKAQKDLLKHTDIKFEWEVATKIRKAVHSIKFKIYPNHKNIKEEIKLPPYLKNFITYVNYLKENYKGTFKKFFFGNFQIDENSKKQPYFFGIDNNNLVYAVAANGGNSITLAKDRAETILNASYLCALYSEVYRDSINSIDDFEELQKEHLEYFGIVKQAITAVLKEHDPRQKPLI